jgi:hypothetical protein
LATWVSQSDKNHLDNIAKKEKKTAKVDLAIWQNRLEKQVKANSTKIAKKIYSITPKQMYHFFGGIIINWDTFWNSNNCLIKELIFISCVNLYNKNHG